MKGLIFRIRIVQILLWLLPVGLSWGQSSNPRYPVVGKPCPGFFLSDVENFSKKDIQLSDFKGKWLIMDFWDQNCKSCVGFFPKANDLQRTFKENLHFLLVGKNDARWNKDIKKVYDKLRKHYGLSLSIAYDTVLFKQFGVHTVSHIIIIDPKGMVYAVTGSDAITEGKLSELIAGGKPFFRKKLNTLEPPDTVLSDDSNQFLEVQNNSDILYQSVLSIWRPGHSLRILTSPIDYGISEGVFRGAGFDLEFLYKLAYVGTGYWPYEDSLYGEFFPKLILEIRDPSPFRPDFASGKNLYDYSLIIPRNKAKKDLMQRIMQSDLRNYFGYEVTIEDREMPCWNLVVVKGKSLSKLTSNQNEPSRYIGNPSGFTMTNVPIENLLWHIHSHHQDEPPFVNRTGLNTKISITVEAIMNDFNDVRRALQNSGLDLVRGTKKMRVLVVKEPVIN